MVFRALWNALTGSGAPATAVPSKPAKRITGICVGESLVGDGNEVAHIDLLIGKSPTPNEGFDLPLTKAKVLEAVKPLIKA